MIKAFYVKNKKGSSLNLWRTENQKFQVIKNGRFLDLLTGGDYILIHKNYLSIFAAISVELIELFPVKIFQKTKNKTRDDYFEIKIKKQFAVDELSFFKKNQKVVWFFPTRYQLRLIVSENIRLEMENVSEGKINFSDDEKDLMK